MSLQGHFQMALKDCCVTARQDLIDLRVAQSFDRRER